jgi:hypothetical protein
MTREFCLTKCEACGEMADVRLGFAQIPNGFLLYDSTTGQDVEDADSCPRFNCPHDKSDVHFSRMLPSMGSLGEEAHDPPGHWNHPDGPEVPF